MASGNAPIAMKEALTMDKATLLGSVVNKLKDLKRKASEMTELAIPLEVDKGTIDHDLDFGPRRRPGASKLRGCVKTAFSNLRQQVLKGLRLVAIRADMLSVRGRTKSVLILCSEDGVCVDSLKQSLKVILNKIASSSMASSSDRSRIRSKRQRCSSPLLLLMIIIKSSLP